MRVPVTSDPSNYSGITEAGASGNKHRENGGLKIYTNDGSDRKTRCVEKEKPYKVLGTEHM